MDRNRILGMIGEEINRLERVRELLGATGETRMLNGHSLKGSTIPKKRVLSEDARNRIAQAQRRRWAKQRREAAVLNKAS